MPRHTSLLVSMLAAQPVWMEQPRRRHLNGRTTEESVLLALCVVGALAVAPFVILRLLRGDWLLAGIDASLVVGVAILATYVWTTRRVRNASIVLTVFYLTLMVLVVHIDGMQSIYWAYPSMAAAYFIVRPKEAAALNILAMLALIPVISQAMAPINSIGLVITLATSNLFSFIFALRTIQHREQLTALASRDPLTGAGNRRSLQERLQEVIAIKERQKENVSVVVVDLDHFKIVNDTFGHGVGDEVLMRIAEIIRARIRITDGLYRLGGDEFAVVLMSANLTIASRFAEQIRKLILDANLLPQHRITVSLGAAELQPRETAESLMERADVALYEAKHNGRNQTKINTDIST